MNQSLTVFERPEEINQETIAFWFRNLLIEIEDGGYNETQIAMLKDPKNYYGKYLNKNTRPFFLRHFSGPIAEAINFLFEFGKSPRIMDFGCGCGSQSLLFAMLGAEVIGFDISREAIATCEARKQFYEERSGKRLNFTPVCGDIFDIKLEHLGPFNALYSLSAFNMMQPSGRLISKISKVMNDDARLAIQDGNRLSWVGRFFRKRRVLSPPELATELNKNGWKVVSQKGCISIPPIFWSFIPNELLRPMDAWLSSSWFFSLSHLTLARRG